MHYDDLPVFAACYMMREVDIAFVIDSSTSMFAVPDGWRTIRAFIKDFVNSFDIGTREYSGARYSPKFVYKFFGSIKMLSKFYFVIMFMYNSFDIHVILAITVHLIWWEASIEVLQHLNCDPELDM